MSVAVVIPARDAEAFLAEALSSVVGQDPTPAEIVVVDDGSTDATAEIAAGFDGVRLVRQAPRGIPVARNAGVAACRSSWIAFLDADDLWLPGKLATQLAAAAAEPDLEAVFTHLRNEFIRPELAERYSAAFGDRPGLHASTLMVRRAVLERSGGFDETSGRVEFIEWFMRARDAGLRYRVLEEVLAVRRIHGANTSIVLKGHELDYVRFARSRLLARRRDTEGRE